jgi:hypothetical protein
MFWRKKQKDSETELKKKIAEAEKLVADALKDVHNLTPEEQQELKRLAAAAGIAGSSLKIAQTIKNADDFGDKMHEQTLKMIEEAHAMAQGAAPKGGIDPAKLEAANERLKALIAQEKEKITAPQQPAQPAGPIEVMKPLRLKKPAAGPR